MLINKEMIEKAKADIYKRENGLYGRKSVFGLYRNEHDAIIGVLVDYVLGKKAAVCTDSYLMATVDTVEREYKELENSEKRYMVKREFRTEWNTTIDIDDDMEWHVTDADIARLATEWGKDKANLMAQVEEA